MAQFLIEGLNEAVEFSLRRIDEMIDVACTNGTWNFSPYFHGMANGMIFLRSMITGEDPKYMDAPDVWLEDIPHNISPLSKYESAEDE